MPYADSAGAQIWWEESGSGDPLLLIMGLGFPASLWFRVLPDLAAGFRVITIDNRGTGKTGALPGPYPVEVMAADALAVLDAAGIDRAHVLGISMGGLLAQELALTAPDRVQTLVLAATHPGGAELVAPDPEVMQILFARADLPLEQSYRATATIAYAPTTPQSVIDEDIEARLANPTSAEGYLAQLHGASAYAGTAARLPSLAVPTLCLHGDLDRLVPLDNGHNLAKMIPGARLQIIDGAGHMLFSDAPDAFVAAIADFVATAPAAARQ